MEQEEEENPMQDHFDNAELNVFNDNGIGEGLGPELMKKTACLLLRLPYVLNKNGVYNLVKQFGDVKRVYIHNDAGKSSGNRLAFIDFATFAEAERACRCLNSIDNSGLGIKAEFSYPRAKNRNLMENNDQEENENHQPEEAQLVAAQEEDPQIHLNNIASINFEALNSTPNDIYASVSQFEYQDKKCNDPNIQNQLEELKKLADKCEWDVGSKNNIRTYNKKQQKVLNYLCYRCNKPATLRDNNSRKYFCSLTCFNDNGESTASVQEELKKSDKVCIVAIINEKCIYIRRSEDDHMHLLESVYCFAKNELRGLQLLPDIGDEVLVTAFERIYRAKILEIFEYDGEYEFDVQLTDIGSVIKVECGDTFEMTSKCYELPKLVTKVYLKDVDLNAINMDVIDYLVNLREEKQELVIKSIEIDQNGKILVELKDDCGNVVNEKIAQLSNVKFEENELEVVQETLTASTGRFKNLFCISKKFLKSENLILCLEENFVKDYFEYQKALHDYGSKLDPASCAARLNEYCLVKVNDDLWYRGFVMQMAGDGAPLCIINDIEDVRKIPIENIFPLPTVFTRNPFYFECYYIEKYNEMNEEEINRIDKIIIENNFFIANKVEKKDDKFFIKLHN